MHALAAMFHARASVTPKRVLRSLRNTQKVLATGRQTKRTTPGAPRTARPSKCAISQSKHEPEAACPYTQPQKSSAHVRFGHAQKRVPRSCRSHIGVRNANGTANKNSAGRATDCPPTKCTILSDTRALSGPPVHHTTAEVPLMPLGHESVPGTLCIQNVLATAHQTAGATLAGAPPTARLSKCTISSVTRAWSGMTTLKPRQRSTHVLEHAQTHHGIPLHTKDARNSTSDSARNSRVRHPARPSKCTISSTVRARSGTPTHIIIYIY